MAVWASFYGAFWVGLIAVLVPNVIDLALQPTFPVHNAGGVLITGASSGIGRHAAIALDGLGYTVFAGVRKEKDGKSLQDDAPQIHPVLLDVTQQDSIDAAVAEVSKVLKERKQTLVALVNNAGVQKDMPVELQSSADNRFNFEVNVFGLFDVTRAVIPLLRETGPGARIVNVGSLAGILAAPGSASYSGSKFAVEGITDALRLEMSELQISVSLLQPGYVKTGMASKMHVSSADSYGVTKEEFERYRRTVFDGFFVKDKMLAEPPSAMHPADTTTPAIVDAIQSPVPRVRYPVAFVDGFPAKVLVMIKTLLPDRVMDFLVLET
eukprot:m.198674 g.198674  ORF g.198674 m.198674 type:complete len:324 (+) comp20511_c0_seq1:132-1103(+)